MAKKVKNKSNNKANNKSNNKSNNKANNNLNKKTSKIKESDPVYSSLRSEILLIEEMQRNMYLHMYSFFCVLYAMGIQFGHRYFLLAFIILIPIQSKINYYSWSINKRSIYIRVFFEEVCNNKHWETFQTYPRYRLAEEHKKKSIWGVLGHFSTALLGTLAAVSFISQESKKLTDCSSVSEIVISCALILVAIILAVITWVVARRPSRAEDAELFTLISSFKDDLEQGHTPADYRY